MTLSGQSYEELRADRDALSARLQTVRALHERRTGPWETDFCREDNKQWPCTTIRLLDASLGTPGDETATARLCDERGMTEYRRPGNPYPCTGSMHVGPDEVVRCDNPIHVLGSPGDEKPQPREPESMRWRVPGDDLISSLDDVAARIVAWINGNSGEARCESAALRRYCHRIAIRTATGWDYAKPGDRIAKGETWFKVPTPDDADSDHAVTYRALREFTVSPVKSSGSAE